MNDGRAPNAEPKASAGGADAGIEGRKSDHLDLTISGDVGFRRTTLLEQVQLVHCALPELDYARLDTHVRLFGRDLRAPLVIAGMTGGNARAGEVNRRLAEVAERGGYALGLGSQRAMIRGGRIDPEVLRTYQLRDIAPSVPLFGNIGVIQAAALPTSLLTDMLGAVGADALCVHLNPAQEMIQAHGDRDFRGAVETLARLVRELGLPVIAKETGCGISPSVALTLAQHGVRHVDVSGAGGTSWVGVETRRAVGDDARRGGEFWDWGIPTAASVLSAHRVGFDTVIATGGVKTGLDVARALALGASVAGLARPVLQALEAGGVEGALARLAEVEADLRTAMLLTGAGSVAALGRVPRVLGPELRAWAEL
jgi:isopentenyl-diphosphate delta-isomerase